MQYDNNTIYFFLSWRAPTAISYDLNEMAVRCPPWQK